MSDFDSATFYDCRDNEHLSHTDPEEALTAYVEDVAPLDPGGFDPWIRAHGPFTVTAYARNEVSDQWIARIAGGLAENAAESFSDDFGNPEDPGGEVDVKALRAALLPPLTEHLRRAVVWQCSAIATRDYSPEEVIAMMSPAPRTAPVAVDEPEEP